MCRIKDCVKKKGYNCIARTKKNNANLKAVKCIFCHPQKKKKADTAHETPVENHWAEILKETVGLLSQSL